MLEKSHYFVYVFSSKKIFHHFLQHSADKTFCHTMYYIVSKKSIQQSFKQIIYLYIILLLTISSHLKFFFENTKYTINKTIHKNIFQNKVRIFIQNLIFSQEDSLDEKIG